MHFKNEASPAANPYTPKRRGDQAVSRAAGQPASLCASPEAVPPHGHTPEIPPCPGGTTELRSSSARGGRRPTCHHLVQWCLLPVGCLFPPLARGRGMLLPLAFSTRHRVAATETPREPGARSPKIAQGGKRFTLGRAARGSPGDGPEPSSCVGQLWGDGLPGAMASSLQHRIGLGHGKVNHLYMCIQRLVS